jgi:1-phosphofructokinase family hexose kinase
VIICLGPTPALARTMTFAKITPDGVNRAVCIHEFAAGKATNVARVLHTLGEKALLSGFIGGDNGEILRADLDQVGIANDFVTVKPTTREAITAIDQSARTATELLEEAQPLAAQDYFTLLGKLSQHLDEAKILVLSGRLPPKAGEDFYAQCQQTAGSSVRVIVDTVGPALLATLAHRPFVIKPNQSEIAATLGIEITSEKALRDAMRQLVDRGAQWVVATRGKEATVVSNGKSFWSVSTPEVKVVSAIGSGDAFAAGLAAALVHGDAMPEAFKLAAACGAANAQTAYAGHLDAQEVRRLAGSVRVVELASS